MFAHGLQIIFLISLAGLLIPAAFKIGQKLADRL